MKMRHRYSIENAECATIQELDKYDCYVLLLEYLGDWCDRKTEVKYRFNHTQNLVEFEFPNGEIFSCALGLYFQEVIRIALRLYAYNKMTTCGDEYVDWLRDEEFEKGRYGVHLVIQEMMDNHISVLLDKFANHEHEMWIWEEYIEYAVKTNNTAAIDLIPMTTISNIISSPDWKRAADFNVYLIESGYRRTDDPMKRFEL